MGESIQMKCQHLRRIGDNYGVSCGDCGAQLCGMGFWGEGKLYKEARVCIHDWVEWNETEEVCTFCQAVRVTLKQNPNSLCPVNNAPANGVWRTTPKKKNSPNPSGLK